MVAPFTIGAFSLVDARELARPVRHAVAVALREGLSLIPGGDQCVERGLDPEGDYPILSFGVFEGAELVGAWWIGCNRLAARSTPRAIVLHSVPLFGWTPGNLDFLEVGNLVTVGTWFLENELQRRDGGTVQVASFSVTFDAANKSHGPLLEDTRDEAAARGDVNTREVAKDGRTEVTYTKKAGR